MDSRVTAARHDGATGHRNWTTAGCREPEQFAVWQEVVSEAFVPVTITRDASGPFHSSLRTSFVDGLVVSSITSQAHKVSRTRPHIERRRGNVFFLNLPLTSGATVEQDGRRARLAPGDFALVDSARPFELEFDRSFRQISVALPHEALAPLLPARTSVTGVRVPGNEGIGAVASAAVRALPRAGATLDRQGARVLSGQLSDLIALALAGLTGRATSTRRRLLIQRLLDEVERSLADPDLSPRGVAERIGISARYLHELFADHGSSFGRWVLTRRLERCRANLGDPRRSHWSIGEIAHEHGFRDPSHFSRAFKARYGMTPREARTSTRSARDG